jgi:uncharacterized lipoprotein YehR (DUF1307 family)
LCKKGIERKKEMNKSSKLRGLILAGALVVAMAGCGNQVQGEQPENTKDYFEEERVVQGGY